MSIDWGTPQQNAQSMNNLGFGASSSFFPITPAQPAPLQASPFGDFQMIAPVASAFPQVSPTQQTGPQPLLQVERLQTNIFQKQEGKELSIEDVMLKTFEVAFTSPFGLPTTFGAPPKPQEPTRGLGLDFFSTPPIQPQPQTQPLQPKPQLFFAPNPNALTSAATDDFQELGSSQQFDDDDDFFATSFTSTTPQKPKNPIIPPLSLSAFQTPNFSSFATPPTVAPTTPSPQVPPNLFSTPPPVLPQTQIPNLPLPPVVGLDLWSTTPPPINPHQHQVQVDIQTPTGALIPDLFSATPPSPFPASQPPNPQTQQPTTTATPSSGLIPDLFSTPPLQHRMSSPRAQAPSPLRSSLPPRPPSPIRNLFSNSPPSQNNQSDGATGRQRNSLDSKLWSSTTPPRKLSSSLDATPSLEIPPSHSTSQRRRSLRIPGDFSLNLSSLQTSPLGTQEITPTTNQSPRGQPAPSLLLSPTVSALPNGDLLLDVSQDSPFVSPVLSSPSASLGSSTDTTSIPVPRSQSSPVDYRSPQYRQQHQQHESQTPNVLSPRIKSLDLSCFTSLSTPPSPISQDGTFGIGLSQQNLPLPGTFDRSFDNFEEFGLGGNLKFEDDWFGSTPPLPLSSPITVNVPAKTETAIPNQIFPATPNMSPGPVSETPKANPVHTSKLLLAQVAIQFDSFISFLEQVKARIHDLPSDLKKRVFQEPQIVLFMQGVKALKRVELKIEFALTNKLFEEDVTLLEQIHRSRNQWSQINIALQGLGHPEMVVSLGKPQVSASFCFLSGFPLSSNAVEWHGHRCDSDCLKLWVNKVSPRPP